MATEMTDWNEETRKAVEWQMKRVSNPHLRNLLRITLAQIDHLTEEIECSGGSKLERIRELESELTTLKTLIKKESSYQKFQDDTNRFSAKELIETRNKKEKS